ncbi:MAG TPA: hypothetical protein VE077_02600 [Candidatus Methylomirabilis sp.]|nr:hypothetical protein [Candidatus Methylomirabilis sp.]
MLSDRTFSFAGRSFTVTSHELLWIGGAILVCLLLWSAIYFSRRRVVLLRRSSGTDQIAFELSRIADALERIANQPADRAIAAAARRQQPQPQAPPVSQPSRSASAAYSIFRR